MQEKVLFGTRVGCFRAPTLLAPSIFLNLLDLSGLSHASYVHLSSASARGRFLSPDLSKVPFRLNLSQHAWHKTIPSRLLQSRPPALVASVIRLNAGLSVGLRQSSNVQRLSKSSGRDCFPTLSLASPPGDTSQAATSSHDMAASSSTVLDPILRIILPASYGLGFFGGLPLFLLGKEKPTLSSPSPWPSLVFLMYSEPP